MGSPLTSATPKRASKWCRRLDEARARPSCLKLKEEEQVGKDFGETPCSKEEDEVEVVQLIGISLRCPPVKRWRGGGAVLQWWEDGEAPP